MLPSTVVVALHAAASAILVAYAAHRLRLAIRFLRLTRRWRTIPPCWTAPLPRVTVQLPLFNERYVADRVIAAAGRLDYPSELLEIQVLDDSTDETAAVAAAAVARLRRVGICASHVRRPVREGFKAGALAAGLERARGELIAVFDADFVPSADFLLRVVGEFRDPSVGMVQARWTHLNRASSWLTRAQALLLDGHFTVEHGVRAATGCFFNFNGTAGVWRRTAIESAGGWSAATLTEDLDLSYRAQLAGWRFVYRDDIEVPAELPVEVAAYRGQQQRWAQGGVQTAIRMLPSVVRSALPGRVKREAFWQLSGNVIYPMLVVLAVASVAAGWFGAPAPSRRLLAADGAMLALAGVCLATFYGVTARARRPATWWRELALVPLIMMLGAGIALGQSVAVLRGLRRRPATFQRTPKYSLHDAADRRWRQGAYRLKGIRGALAECAIGGLLLAVAVGALGANAATALGPVFLFGAGMLTVAGSDLWQQTPRLAAPVLRAAPRAVDRTEA